MSSSVFLAFSCFVFVLLLGYVTTLPEEVRQKRSDDGGPMETVVEQLSQQVNDLNAQLTQQANSFTAQLNSVNAEVAALKNKTDTLDKMVAFHAWNSDNPVQATTHGIIILNHAVTNIGNGYNTLTGVFTAPVSGLYDFQATIMSYDPGVKLDIYAGIYVGSSEVGRMLSDSRHGYFSQSTVKAIVHVNAGQQVYLKNTDGRVAEYYDSLGEPYTTFSGFLIRAD